MATSGVTCREMKDSIDNFRSVLVISYGTAIGAIVFNTQPALVGALANSFGFTKIQLGNIMATTLVAIFCLVVSSFYWVHRVASRTTVIAGTLAAVFGALSLGFASNFVGVSLSLALIGAGTAAIYVVCLACLATARDPTRAFGVSITIQVAVASITVYLIPAYAIPLYGFKGVAGLLACLFVLAFGMLPFIPPNQRIDSAIEKDQALGRKVMLLAPLGLGAMFIYFVGLNGTWVFLERIGADMALSAEVIGQSLAISLLFGAIGSLIASIAGRRIGTTAALTLSGVGFLVFILLLGNANSALVYTLALIIFNAAWNFSLPYQMDLISRADANARYIVLIPAAQTMGGAVGPAIAGPILMSGGVTGVYVQLVVCIGVAFLLYALLANGLSRHHATGSRL